MLGIFLLSHTRGQVINEAGLGAESLHINGHFLLFLVLTAAFFKFLKNVPLSILATILYALFDEFHQSFVPDRSASVFDLVVDTLGSIIGGILLWKLQFLLPKSLKNWLNS